MGSSHILHLSYSSIRLVWKFSTSIVPNLVPFRKRSPASGVAETRGQHIAEYFEPTPTDLPVLTHERLRLVGKVGCATRHVGAAADGCAASGSTIVHGRPFRTEDGFAACTIRDSRRPFSSECPETAAGHRLRKVADSIYALLICPTELASIEDRVIVCVKGHVVPVRTGHEILPVYCRILKGIVKTLQRRFRSQLDS